MFDLSGLPRDSNFEECDRVARLVKDTLDLLELEGFPKTSGSRGIHVLVPSSGARRSPRRGGSPGSSPARSLVRIPGW